MPGDPFFWFEHKIQPDPKSFVIEAYRTKKTFDQVCRGWLDRQGSKGVHLSHNVVDRMVAELHSEVDLERQRVADFLSAKSVDPKARTWAYCMVWGDPESHCIDPGRTDNYDAGQQPQVIVFMNGTRLLYDASQDRWNLERPS